MLRENLTCILHLKDVHDLHEITRKNNSKKCELQNFSCAKFKKSNENEAELYRYDKEFDFGGVIVDKKVWDEEIAIRPCW